MIHCLIRYLSGYVKIQIKGYSPERFLNLCCYHRIRFWGLTRIGTNYELYLSLSDFRKIRPYVRKTHTKVILKKRYGFPFFLYRYRKRKLFFISIFLCIFLIDCYSQFLWDIHFQGNKRWTDATLTTFLKEEGIYPGMQKKNVDCQGIVKALRKEYNDIVWVSASLDGSRLKIQIKENEDALPIISSTQTDKSNKTDSLPADLVASTDGIITKLITRTGIPQVHIGDSVTKGTLLVSGRIDILDDSGEITGYQYTHADADIFADTQISYLDIISCYHNKKVYTKETKKSGFIQIGSVRLETWKPKTSDSSEKFCIEHQLKMGENFSLPVLYGHETIKKYGFRKIKYTKKEMQTILSSRFRYFCKDLEEKGIQINEKNVKIYISAEKATASGTLYLNQQIEEETETERITLERNEPDESVGTDH